MVAHHAAKKMEELLPGYSRELRAMKRWRRSHRKRNRQRLASHTRL